MAGTAALEQSTPLHMTMDAISEHARTVHNHGHDEPTDEPEPRSLSAVTREGIM